MPIYWCDRYMRGELPSNFTWASTCSDAWEYVKTHLNLEKCTWVWLGGRDGTVVDWECDDDPTLGTMKAQGLCVIIRKGEDMNYFSFRPGSELDEWSGWGV